MTDGNIHYLIFCGSFIAVCAIIGLVSVLNRMSAARKQKYIARERCPACVLEYGSREKSVDER